MTQAAAESLVDLLLTRPPTLGPGRLLAIDGRSGSGKSTVADEVAGLLPERGESVAVVRLDDLYDGWGGLDDALQERVLTQLLRPLAAQRPARWQRYAWDAGAFAEWHLLEPPDVVVLEGCGAGAVRYAPYTSLLVWVEAPAPRRLAQALARDGDALLEHWAAWSRSEDVYLAANRTPERADVTLER